MTANPGISMPEAVVRLNAHNAALARGLTPTPITGLGALSGMYGGSSVSVLGAGGILGEGGPATKPHREL